VLIVILLRYQGKYEAAEEMNRRVLAGSEKVLGRERLDTLTSVGNLASVLQEQGKYEVAEEMNRRVLGVEHPFALTSVSNLVSSAQDQGKYEVAEEMNQRALAGGKKLLGVEHPREPLSTFQRKTCHICTSILSSTFTVYQI
jgi:tetratricopeptide (TPR) repeat protein